MVNGYYNTFFESKQMGFGLSMGADEIGVVQNSLLWDDRRKPKHW